MKKRDRKAEKKEEGEEKEKREEKGEEREKKEESERTWIWESRWGIRNGTAVDYRVNEDTEITILSLKYSSGYRRTRRGSFSMKRDTRFLIERVLSSSHNRGILMVFCEYAFMTRIRVLFWEWNHREKLKGVYPFSRKYPSFPVQFSWVFLSLNFFLFLDSYLLLFSLSVSHFEERISHKKKKKVEEVWVCELLYWYCLFWGQFLLFWIVELFHFGIFSPEKQFEGFFRKFWIERKKPFFDIEYFWIIEEGSLSLQRYTQP